MSDDAAEQSPPAQPAFSVENMVVHIAKAVAQAMDLAIGAAAVERAPGATMQELAARMRSAHLPDGTHVYWLDNEPLIEFAPQTETIIDDDHIRVVRRHRLLNKAMLAKPWDTPAPSEIH